MLKILMCYDSTYSYGMCNFTTWIVDAHSVVIMCNGIINKHWHVTAVSLIWVTFYHILLVSINGDVESDVQRR